MNVSQDESILNKETSCKGVRCESLCEVFKKVEPSSAVTVTGSIRLEGREEGMAERSWVSMK